ncbi:protein of unknown function DUF4149 [Penicillium brevicompactum]
MEKALRTASSFLPYHLLAYGTLLGTQLFHSFVNTKICYKALSMDQFVKLQKQIFPIYFATQVSLTALTAVTRPPFGIFSLAKDPWSAAPLAIAGVASSLNWYIYGPKTSSASMKRRLMQVTENPISDPNSHKAHSVNRNFARNHAMAIHLNAIAVIATVLYGFSLSATILDGRHI